MNWWPQHWWPGMTGPLRVRVPIGVAALAVQGAVWTSCWLGVPVLSQPYVVLGGHVFGALLAGAAFPGWRRDARGRRHDGMVAYFATGLALMFPIVGAAGALVALIGRGRAGSAFDEVVAEYRTLVDATFPVEDIESDARENFVGNTWSALELRPFVDIVAAEGKESDLAASAIESAELLDQLTACRLLRFALASAVPATRYYAARAIARVEEKLDSELARCLKLVAAKPDDAAALFALARARVAYGDLAVGDDPLIQLHLEEARRLLESILPRLLGEDQETCLVNLANVSVRLGNMERGREIYDQLVQRGTRRVEVFRGLAVCLHTMRDYVGLRRTLSTARERCPDSPMVVEMCTTWGVE
jgi:hypothetical protein